MMRRSIGLATATLCALALLPASASAVAPARADAPPAGASSRVGGVLDDVAPIEWAPCGEALPGLECATYAVPRSYDDPTGPTTDLAVIRYPASDQENRVGPLFVNPGGPGKSAVETVSGAGAAYDEFLGGRFDIVGVDPRGVGASEPIDCWSDEEYLERLGSATISDADRAFRNASKQGAELARACQRNAADLLPYLGTDHAARDMDVVRAAMGDQRLSYLGYSYGTYLGTVYADLFPSRVRAAVLDGAYDPVRYTRGGYAQDIPQAVAADHALSRFFAWCDKAGEACGFGDGDSAAAFDALAAQLDRDPVDLPAAEDVPSVTANAVTLAFTTLNLLSRGQQRGYGNLATLLTGLAAGEGDLLQLVNASSVSSFDANVAVECNDRVFPRSTKALRAGLDAQAAAGPRLGRLLAYTPPAYDQTHAPACTRWAAERKSTYQGDFRAQGSAPIVVVGTTGDPDTPYQDSVALSHILDNASLVTFEGTTHTATGNSDCVTSAVQAYLTELTVPANGLRCADEAAPGSP
ncbi:MAG: alpha/beta fold hydrolase [Dermatophilaceae bacterium]